MLWLKCRVIFILVLIPMGTFAQTYSNTATANTGSAKKFSSNECLHATFATEIKHAGKFFGLIKNKLEIEKNECIISINFKNIFETKWKIDICREPLHIKVTSRGTQSVYKRRRKCEGSDDSDFCVFFNELESSLQDHGLIFADGEREDLSSSHGQTYCSFLLLKRYLEDGHLFSKFDESINIFKSFDGKPSASCDIPTVQKQAVNEKNSSSTSKTQTSKTQTSKTQTSKTQTSKTQTSSDEIDVEEKANKLLEQPSESPGTF